MTPLDVLRAPEFASDRLSESINIPPFVTGLPSRLGIFSDRPMRTTYVKLEVKDNEIAIIPSMQRGGPANKNMRGGTATTMFPIPHFPLDDALGPEDLQNIIAFGTDNAFVTAADVLNDKLTDMRTKHDQTLNHLEWGALKGNILDAKGIVLLNTYSQMGVAQPTHDFQLSSNTLDIAGRNRSLKEKIRVALRGSYANRVVLLSGATFFDTYVAHPGIKEALKAYRGDAPNPAREDIDDTYSFAGLTLYRVEEEFNVRNEDGSYTALPAVEADEAIALPMGTQLFRRYLAPPDTIATANQAPSPANRVHVSTAELPHGKGLDIHTESNALPVCVRPDVMVKITMS
jgi:hypothetical protein